MASQPEPPRTVAPAQVAARADRNFHLIFAGVARDWIIVRRVHPVYRYVLLR